MEKHVIILLANGHEEIEAFTQIDLLRRAGIKVTVVGLGGIEIVGGHNIKVIADIPIEQVQQNFDALILPGGLPGTTYLAESNTVKSIIKDSFDKGILVGAICAAPLVLDVAGVLNNKKYTCYPGVNEKIKSGKYIEESVVQDSNIITSRGVGTAIPFALKIIEYLLDIKQSQNIASSILFSY